MIKIVEEIMKFDVEEYTPKNTNFVILVSLG